VIPFDQWKQEGKILSYFHKHILDYDNRIRYYIFETTIRYEEIYPFKISHRGWQYRGEMTPQAWTVFEILAGLSYLDPVTDRFPNELKDSLYFISTGIQEEEINIVWEELLNTMYICDDYKGAIWVGVCMAIIIGYNNQQSENDYIQLDNYVGRSIMRYFLTRVRKIELLRELFYNNAPEIFDGFLKWIYENGRVPELIRHLFSYHEMTVEHIRSLSCDPLPVSPLNGASSYHPESPLEQIEPLDSASSQFSPDEEASQNQ
jgi:hypothetical protein